MARALSITMRMFNSTFNLGTTKMMILRAKLSEGTHAAGRVKGSREGKGDITGKTSIRGFPGQLAGNKVTGSALWRVPMRRKETEMKQ
ncbi:hypothetical protein KQX54_020150 [Cotesia glomerata]|uniref:Uncharacterized protein n=1 Tax=Cotesia glomerata TaxID=32391 RepID=A0AAV7I2Q8_COTGL|nr:hypothetical protein KQX54_020150 [Cotesia glomerata]